MQQAEITSSLVEQINAAHTACMATAEDARDMTLRACNRARECGELLQQLREQSKGEWQAMFADRGDPSKTRFTFTYQTAQNYINFYKAHPAPIIELAEGVKSLTKAMVAAGALPARTHENQNDNSGEFHFFISAGKQLMAFSALWEKQMGLHPVDNWAPEIAEQFVVQIEPVLEKVNGIYATAKAKALELKAA